MGHLKAQDVDAWLARHPAPPPIVLVYGPDRGLVSERARSFAQASGIALDDPFSLVRLDAAELDRQPGRLADEANTLPMFAGRRLIWVRNALGQKAVAEDVKALCADPPFATQILIEAGDLKKGLGLRATVESCPHALALPCYLDDERTVDAVIDMELGRAGLTIDADTRAVLKRGLGGDRLATRGELEKLVLASTGRRSIDLVDVRALGADASGASADDIVDSVLAGDIQAFDRIFSCQMRNASQAFTILSAMQRQFQVMLVMRLAMERDRKSASGVVAAARPTMFFSRRKLLETALERWNAAALIGMLDALQKTVLETRRRPDLATALAHKALLGIVLASRLTTAKR